MSISNDSLANPPMTNEPLTNELGLDRQRRIRRNVWLLAALAVAFYIAFIAMSVSGARG